VTVDASTALATVRVMVMSGEIVDSRIVAAAAEGVSFEPERAPMRVVAIGAGDPFAVHATLEEGAVHVDLIEDLPVVVIETRFQQTQQVCF
jgi:hypothetical protein